MQKVVLFGAGASYGATRIVPDKPPLGRDLYGELVRCFPPSWGNLPADVRKEFSQGFEQGMQVIWDKYSQNVALLMRHMTLYFAQFRSDGSRRDLYSRFLRRLQERGVADQVLYSTLNYECTLEIAASMADLKIEYWHNPLESGVIRVWKLHGSCNFIPANIQVGEQVLFTRGLVIEGGLQAVEPNAAIQFCLSGTGLYPAMALYMNAKPVQIGQSVILDLQQKWGDVVRDAKHVLVIGVRPYPEDGHIWGPLAECQGTLGFVGPEDDFNSWVQTHRNGKVAHWLGSRWDAALSETVQFFVED